MHDGIRLRRSLRDQGFCVLPGFLAEDRLSRLFAIAEAARERGPQVPLRRDSYSGQVVELGDLPELAGILRWPEPFDLLRAMGFPDPRWFMAFLFQKPPRGEALYWHQDWWGWADPASYVAAPQLLFLMFYLVDTDTHNGCLRVLPGSHLQPHPLHQTSALTDYIDFDADRNAALFAHQPGEIDVPSRRGDLIIRDARLLHATHPNDTGIWRPMLSLSVAPAFSSLDTPMRRTMEIKRPKLERRWPASHWDQVRDMMSLGPRDGDALEISRTPAFRDSPLR